MHKKMGLQEAFDELSKQVFQARVDALETRIAVVYLGVNLIDRLVGSQIASYDDAVHRLKLMADAAAETVARVPGAERRPNPVLLNIAELLESASEPWQVIDGGKRD